MVLSSRTEICSRQKCRGRGLFTIELTRGPTWDQPTETIDRRGCATDSIEAATAEALHWLVQTQATVPGRGATHYRVVGENGVTIGGPA